MIYVTVSLNLQSFFLLIAACKNESVLNSGRLKYSDASVDQVRVKATHTTAV